MSYTRADAETELTHRTSKKMALVGFAVTNSGTNADLNSPLATALRKMGLPVAGSKVADADMSLLTDAQYDEMLDRAELRLLQNIYQNIDFTNIEVGPRREELGQLADQTEKAIGDLEARIKAEYGVGASKLGVGSITHDYAAKGDDGDIFPGLGEI